MDTPERSDEAQPGKSSARIAGGSGLSANGTPLLELVNLSVHYGAVVALDGVSLGVRKGEVVAVMGPNGAGKSTVLKAIMGLAPVVAGEVYWRSGLLAAATHEIVKEGIAFVPQGRRVFTHLTIEENLEMGCLYLHDRVQKKRAGWTRSWSSSRSCTRSVATWPARCPGGSSRCWLWAEDSWPAQRCCCSTSRRWGSRP